jgi:hypothetical protein
MHDPAWQRREAGKNKLRPPQAYRGSCKKFTIAPVSSGLDCKSTALYLGEKHVFEHCFVFYA